MLESIKNVAQQSLAATGVSSKALYDFEHSANPLLRHYLDYRQRVIGTSLKIQSAVAIIAAIALTQLQSNLTLPLGQYALLLSILGIPGLSVLVNARLRNFVRGGWKKRYPRLDYSGAWCYIGQFSVASRSHQLDDTSRKDAREFLENTFHANHESGEVFFEQDVFGLQIREAFGKINGVNVTWSSYPAAFSDKDISWAFRAMILWPAHLGLNPEFNGLERYNVIRHDTKGRPTLLVGPLTGCIQEKNEFALDGKFMYWRKDSFPGLPDEAKGYVGYDEAPTKRLVQPPSPTA